MNQVKKRIVLKVGTSTLTQGTDKISRGKIEDIILQIQELQSEYDIILVSSGAIAAAHQFVKLTSGNDIQVKQALAAIGQLQLMRIYQEVCQDHDVRIAQCLLTYHDFNNEDAKANIKNTIETLLSFGYVPIINENDTVATDEIKFGDNDKLAALTAILTDAELLVLATDTDGVYDKDPKFTNEAKLLESITDIETLIDSVSDSKSKQGSGGMKSKLEAADLAQKSGIPTWIINGRRNNFFTGVLNGEYKYTSVPIY